MDRGPLTERIIETFDAMPAQLQAGARYVLDRPRDVALLSMREQARQAGVQPATMTRLAKRLGMDGYDEVRELYAAAVREGDLGFAGKAGVQVVSQKLRGDKALAADMLASIGHQIRELATPAGLERLVNAAKVLAAARRIYCLGLRSSHSIAWHLHYVLTLVGDRSVHIDGIGATGSDALARATNKDVLLVASVLPYMRWRKVSQWLRSPTVRSRRSRKSRSTPSSSRPRARPSFMRCRRPLRSPRCWARSSPGAAVILHWPRSGIRTDTSPRSTPI
jgi:DNA-binding MurR/RpiR family transcriptional regulator